MPRTPTRKSKLQLDLFGDYTVGGIKPRLKRPRPGTRGARGKDPASRWAYDAVGRSASYTATLILGALESAPGGMTCDEIAARHQSSILTVRPTMRALELQRLVVKSGRFRENGNGRKTNVFVLTPRRR